MRKSILKIIAAFCIISSFAACQKDKKDGMLDVGVIKQTCDLQDIKLGTSVNDFFIIKNNGDKTIIYKDVIVECGCTSVEKKGDSILAGKTDSIKFSFNSEGLDTGSFQRRVRIITDAKPDLISFTIKGRIIE